jgi:hypothetical protein
MQEYHSVLSQHACNNEMRMNKENEVNITLTTIPTTTSSFTIIWLQSTLRIIFGISTLLLQILPKKTTAKHF